MNHENPALPLFLLISSLEGLCLVLLGLDDEEGERQQDGPELVDGVAELARGGHLVAAL